MIQRRSRLAAALVAAAALIQGAALAAPSLSEIRDAAAATARRLDLQTELPRQAEEPRRPSGGGFSLPPETLWVLLIVGAGLVLYAFRDELSAWRPGGRKRWSEAEASASSEVARAAVLESADELAAAGRFDEAMHALLLRGLAEIRGRLDEELADSLTSREILRHTKLSERGRAPLRELVERVERAWFGEYGAEREDYLACRERFGELMSSLEGEVPA